jgi:hypothetical protein
MSVIKACRKGCVGQTICSVIGFTLCVLLVYGLLLGAPGFFSIHGACCLVDAASGVEGVLLAVLLPIYVATLLFGGAAFGWYLGRLFYRRIIC